MSSRAARFLVWHICFMTAQYLIGCLLGWWNVSLGATVCIAIFIATIQFFGGRLVVR